ncbi:MAG: xanthine dehydrogenase family protein subunit M [Armatimonadota bacterium]|nr:xanthine dehydrogenase family protein subunit M [Armatimonadota bacterium]MDR7421382.1 xanthine dehydrogenase family protein subunit M [Armatimonadota bacterium]MDR7453898.1 xanthine dehydrogenase family protein subunit M [Armatimonadota bacterium]MDR7456680.1 xanthine dehydrogenase family protein subunit M [Armatimonadota bacterium]MDR7495725.1 xanthine dehydrogenase family protein subunit M [Armatimonadota bacterium]
MIPAAFDYAAPATLDEALRLLRRHRHAKVMAGGQSLLSLMKLRVASPSFIIDLRRIGRLAYVKEDKGAIAVGAMTTHAALAAAALVRRRLPALAQAAEAIGDLQVRNVGTIGGSLAHADPAADYPAVLLACDGVVVVRGPRGTRKVPAGQWFTGLFATALRSGEIVVEVQFPILPAGTRSAYVKMKHPASGFAVVGAAAVVRLGRDGRVADVRLAFTGAASHAFRARAAEEALRGQEPTEAAVRAAMARAPEGVDLLEDLVADAAYRAQLVRVYGARAVLAALG